MSMYKRPPLRVREAPKASTRPLPGSFLDAIVNPPPTVHHKHTVTPVYQKEAYLSLLKRNCKDLGIEYKEPQVPDYAEPPKLERVVEPNLIYSDQVYLKLRILKSGIVRVKLDASFATLYEKFYINCKQPPVKSVIQAYKSIGFSDEFLESIKIKHAKRIEHAKKVGPAIDNIFNKEKPKKPKKKEEEEVVENEEEVENDDEEEEEEDPEEDGGMDIEVDNEDDAEEQPQDNEEEYLSD